MQDFYLFIDALAKSAIVIITLLAYRESRRAALTADLVSKELEKNPIRSAEEVVKKLNGSTGHKKEDWHGGEFE